MSDELIHSVGSTSTLAEKPALKKPPMYQVVMYNDDYTPMDFVVDVLMQIFFLDEAAATSVMMAVHRQGKGVAGVYPKDIAETKTMIVNQVAQEHEHPLKCECEVLPDDNE